MDIAIISDTHMPRGGRRIPAACVERMRAADLIVHAGDLATPAVLAELRRYGEVHAVQGNVDDAGLRALLPVSRTLSVEGVKLALVHDGGPATGRLERLRARFPEADAVIFVRTFRCTSPRRTGFRSSIRAARPSGGARRTTRRAWPASRMKA